MYISSSLSRQYDSTCPFSSLRIPTPCAMPRGCGSGCGYGWLVDVQHNNFSISGAHSSWRPLNNGHRHTFSIFNFLFLRSLLVTLQKAFCSLFIFCCNSLLLFPIFFLLVFFVAPLAKQKARTRWQPFKRQASWPEHPWPGAIKQSKSNNDDVDDDMAHCCLPSAHGAHGYPPPILNTTTINRASFMVMPGQEKWATAAASISFLHTQWKRMEPGVLCWCKCM